MGYNIFALLLAQYKKREAIYEALNIEFNHNLLTALPAVVFQFEPSMKQCKNIEERMFELCKKYGDLIWDDFNAANSMNRTKFKVEPTTIPKPITDAEIEKEKYKLLDQYDMPYHEDFIEVHMENAKNEQAYQTFIAEVHRVMKKGRKNYLFAGSHEGAKRAAMFFKREKYLSA